MPGRLNLPPIIRFLQYVKTGPIDQCWEWRGSIRDTGYGQFTYKGKPARKAHRISYELFYGEFNPSLCVLHTCDNRKCVNPEHLFLGTKKDNTQDMINKGRAKFDAGTMKGEAHPMAKLSETDVKHIRNSQEPTHKLALTYDVTTTTIKDIKSGRSWSHI